MHRPLCADIYILWWKFSTRAATEIMFGGGAVAMVGFASR
jgi:hypothetical protein